MLNNNKKEISKRILILLMLVVVISFVFKAFGSNIFNRFLNSEYIINIGNYIDNNWFLNNLVYGILSYILTYLFVFTISNKYYDKNIIINLLILFISFGFSILRYYFYGVETYIFDTLQYIIFPIIIAKFRYKISIINSLFNALILYFVFNGIMMVTMTLNDLFLIIHSSNFISYILCFIEPYIFMICVYIFQNNNQKEIQNVESNIITK